VECLVLKARRFPQTPTLHALRGERYKYIRAQGVWDLDELCDLQEDPGETRNVILDPAHARRVAERDRRLTEWLDRSGRTRAPAPAGARPSFQPAQRKRSPAGRNPTGVDPEIIAARGGLGLFRRGTPRARPGELRPYGMRSFGALSALGIPRDVRPCP